MAGIAALGLPPAGARTRDADAAPRRTPRVTLITDSVGGALSWAAREREELARGLDFRLETKSCRRLVSEGCFAYDEVAPSALETIQKLGSTLGEIVIVDVGYNDTADGYGAGLDAVMAALSSAGVEHVIWVTLHEAEPTWAGINGEIRAAAARWPQLTVAEWAPVAATHPAWFVDHAHMNELGAAGFAHFLRPLVLDACGVACDPPEPTAALLPPTVREHRALLRWRGDRYAKTFEVSVRLFGGTWHSVEIRPGGKSVRIDGLTGVRMQARVRARDAFGLAGPWSPTRAFRL